ncbi:RlpA-like double-psi beta-barrel domain-containing protein [Nocardia iowensis]|uniref:RlpA-like double-psi beta-barrel domain-containing protein n=1 Tax=Nocardia iowensis TaxID=204891 RepID=A0ABX8RL04_NOCIO|nr:RlpA-like double-psi beta-barrel domain-containing protein [Nocardia iowensis]QXN90253.1 RlpA-like double-psi beta-barrel domain-containing protein [Nocardia iowensis]
MGRGIAVLATVGLVLAGSVIWGADVRADPVTAPSQSPAPHDIPEGLTGSFTGFPAITAPPVTTPARAISGEGPVSHTDFTPASNGSGYCMIAGPYTRDSRVAAIGHLNGKDCGTKLRVTSKRDPSKSVIVTIIDECGCHLDLNEGVYQKLFGTSVSGQQATWVTVP